MTPKFLKEYDPIASFLLHNNIPPCPRFYPTLIIPYNHGPLPSI
uniref:Uncharacterized protein n=1 Tax=Rhizophora mucronata TaxID=61149 RepID=A0A2P2QV98_RHIMU